MTAATTALVLGANGGVGGEVARQLRDAGWTVRAMVRQVSAEPSIAGLEWVKGDAMRAVDVAAAARGCAVIVHAVNPPGYRQWERLVLPMLDNTVRAAIAERATIVLPGTVYNYGPDAPPRLTESSPQHPATRKGKIRVALEDKLREASTQGARVVVVRAGDFFGPHAGSSWFSQALVTPGRPVKRIVYPGRRGIGHQWGYLPDVARTMLQLIERRDDLAPFATFHMDGHWDADGTGMITAIRCVAAAHGGGNVRVFGFPWWLTTLLSPFVTTFREMREMRYLWRQPVRMSNDALRSVLGTEPHTPIDDAVAATLKGLGSLPSR